MSTTDIRRWLRWQSENPDATERIASLEKTLVEIMTAPYRTNS